MRDWGSAVGDRRPATTNQSFTRRDYARSYWAGRVVRAPSSRPAVHKAPKGRIPAPILLPPYSRSTPILLASYPRSTAILLASCFPDRAENAGKRPEIKRIAGGANRKKINREPYAPKSPRPALCIGAGPIQKQAICVNTAGYSGYAGRHLLKIAGYAACASSSGCNGSDETPACNVCSDSNESNGTTGATAQTWGLATRRLQGRDTVVIKGGCHAIHSSFTCCACAAGD
jgi:hypothetical protein